LYFYNSSYGLYLIIKMFLNDYLAYTVPTIQFILTFVNKYKISLLGFKHYNNKLNFTSNNDWNNLLILYWIICKYDFLHWKQLNFIINTNILMFKLILKFSKIMGYFSKFWLSRFKLNIEYSLWFNFLRYAILLSRITQYLM
jgi:hypothetical protein